MRSLERLKQAFQTIQQLRKELTWAMIEQREAEYRALVESATTKREGIERLQLELSELSTCHEKTLAQICELERDLTDHQKRSEPLLQERRSLVEQAKRLEKTMSELKQDAKEINREFAALRTQIEEMDAKIAREAQSTSSRRLAALNTRLAEIEGEEQGLAATIGTHRQAEEGIGQRVAELGERVDRALAEGAELDKATQRLRQQLDNCRNFKRDRIRAFGDGMAAALAEINKNASQFARLPIGPIALHLRIREERWTLALEAILHSNVEAFLVNDHGDRATLQKILRHHGLTNPVVVLRYDGELDTSSGLPDSTFITAMDVLEISSPVVKKALIILCNIEANILIHDRQEAMQVMRQRPHNVQAVYTPISRLNAGSRSVSVTQLYANPNRPRLLQNPENMQRDLEEKLSEAGQRKAIAARDLARLQRDHAEAKDELAAKRQAAEQAERTLRLLKNEARQIQEELRAEESVSHSLFEQEKAETREKMDALAVQFQANAGKLQELQETQEQLHSNLALLDGRITEVREAHEDSMDSISGLLKTRGNIEKEIERSKQALAAAASSFQGADQDCCRAKGALEAMIESAEKICPRMVALRSVPELDRELSAQEECLRAGADESKSADPVALKGALDETRTTLREAEQSIIVNERLVQTLSLSLEERQRAWEDFRRSVSKMSSTEFIFMLTARGFQGSLEYKHHEAELHIRVIPQGQPRGDHSGGRGVAARSAHPGSKSDSTAAEAENRDVRQLSGGEKSYSTACFLFSLWQAMGSPLRCLDEFDVYMVSGTDTDWLAVVGGHQLTIL